MPRPRKANSEESSGIDPTMDSNEEPTEFDLKMVQKAEPKKFDPQRYLTKLSRRARTPDGNWKTVENDYLEVKWRLLWLRTEFPTAILHTELVKHENDLAICKAHIILPNGAEATGYGSETADDWKDWLEKSETKAIGRALAALGFGTQFCDDHDFSQGNTEKVVDAPVAQSKAKVLDASVRISRPDTISREQWAKAIVGYSVDDGTDVFFDFSKFVQAANNVGLTQVDLEETFGGQDSGYIMRYLVAHKTTTLADVLDKHPKRKSAQKPKPSYDSFKKDLETPPTIKAGTWQDRPATEPQIKAIYAIARGAQDMDAGVLEEWCRNRYGVVPAELTRQQASEIIDALKQGAS